MSQAGRFTRDIPLPETELQLRFTFNAGADALRFGAQVKRLIEKLAAEHGRPLTADSAVLDFGCGWGRIIRHFEMPDLWGIDASDEAIAACQATNRYAGFEQVDPLGPAPFEDDRFDLIYGFSVFSHLSEEAHWAWLEEFRRILRPGGLLLLTTLGRSYLKVHAPALLLTYDQGGYAFVSQREHYGITAIPESYVRREWPFEILSYSLALMQMWIVARR